MKEYLDFIVRFRPGEGETYQVDVESSSKKSGFFRRPFDEKDLRIFLLSVGQVRRSRTRGRYPQQLQEAVDFGSKLFHALFQDEVRDLFIQTEHDADRLDKGVRIWLCLDEAPALAHLPWEFLNNGHQFLSLSDEWSIVRYLELSKPVQLVKVDFPLRILVTVSSPRDLPPLDVDKEKDNIHQALASLVDSGWVRIDFTQNASLEILERDMRRATSEGKPFHIWHYIGHGEYDPDRRTSMLALTSDQGDTNMVGGFELNTLFQNYSRSLGLAILNACEGARSDQEDPFAGVAASLIEGGIPAVIAMQFEISDDAAIKFAGEFYAALVDGLPLDTAMSNARRMVMYKYSTEWATPVLFLQLKNTRIFDISMAQRRQTAVSPPTGIPSQSESDLQAIYLRGLNDYYLKRWQIAADSFQRVVDLQPGYRNAADLLAKAQSQLQQTYYLEQAQAAIDAREWGIAAQALQSLLAEQPNHSKAKEMLQDVLRRKQIDDLYGQARLLYEDHKWQAVEAVFEQLTAIDPEFRDPDRLRSAAQQEQIRQEKRDEFEAFRQTALLAIDAGQWQQAQEALDRAQALQPDDPDIQALSSRVKAELRQLETARDLQTRYAVLMRSFKKQNWEEVIAACDEILAIDPAYRDTASRLAQARTSLKEAQDKEKEQAYQKRQNARYDALISAFEAQDWERVITSSQPILKDDPNYRDVPARVEQAQQAIRQAQESEEQRLLDQRQRSRYSQLKQALEAGEWERAITLGERILGESPGYRDVPALVENARRAIAEKEAAARKKLAPKPAEAKTVGSGTAASQPKPQSADAGKKPAVQASKTTEAGSQRLYDRAQKHLMWKRLSAGVWTFALLCLRNPGYKDAQAQYEKAKKSHIQSLAKSLEDRFGFSDGKIFDQLAQYGPEAVNDLLRAYLDANSVWSSLHDKDIKSALVKIGAAVAPLLIFRIKATIGGETKIETSLKASRTLTSLRQNLPQTRNLQAAQLLQDTADQSHTKSIEDLIQSIQKLKTGGQSSSTPGFFGSSKSSTPSLYRPLSTSRSSLLSGGIQPARSFRTSGSSHYSSSSAPTWDDVAMALGVALKNANKRMPVEIPSNPLVFPKVLVETLVDEAHKERTVKGFAEFKNHLVQWGGYHVLSEKPLSKPCLDGKHILVVGGPETPLLFGRGVEKWDSEEVALVHKYVKEGGGLIVLGIIGGSYDALNGLTGEFGIFFTGEAVNVGKPAWVAKHPITSSQGEFRLGLSSEVAGVVLQAKSPAIVLASSRAQDPAKSQSGYLAAREYGLGRVVALSNIGAFSDGCLDQNKAFLDNIIKWLLAELAG